MELAGDRRRGEKLCTRGIMTFGGTFPFFRFQVLHAFNRDDSRRMRLAFRIEYLSRIDPAVKPLA